MSSGFMRGGWYRWALLLLAAVPPAPLLAGGAENTDVDVVSLAPLQVEGRPVRAHTQGLEIVDGQYLVTARQEEVTPRRALLLRHRPGDADWTVWNLTPEGTVLYDHPGGFQSDGQRLWIPLAESRRGGRSRIRAYPIAGWTHGHVPVPEVEFAEEDHIGALAVSREQGLLVGAGWDTDIVYLWDLRGNLKGTLKGTALLRLGLGDAKKPGGGLAVQDWKFTGGILLASGLATSRDGLAVSRLVRMDPTLEPLDPIPKLPSVPGVELAREAMAVAGGWIHFLPEDLGPTNRLFRIRWDWSNRH